MNNTIKQAKVTIWQIIAIIVVVVIVPQIVILSGQFAQSNQQLQQIQTKVDTFQNETKAQTEKLKTDVDGLNIKFEVSAQAMDQMRAEIDAWRNDCTQKILENSDRTKKIEDKIEQLNNDTIPNLKVEIEKNH
jgi:outer membrane murein-binding lipoprotein Lpp